jgi:hypothetical protein
MTPFRGSLRSFLPANAPLRCSIHPSPRTGLPEHGRRGWGQSWIRREHERKSPLYSGAPSTQAPHNGAVTKTLVPPRSAPPRRPQLASSPESFRALPPTYAGLALHASPLRKKPETTNPRVIDLGRAGSSTSATPGRGLSNSCVPYLLARHEKPLLGAEYFQDGAEARRRGLEASGSWGLSAGECGAGETRRSLTRRNRRPPVKTRNP